MSDRPGRHFFDYGRAICIVVGLALAVVGCDKQQSAEANEKGQDEAQAVEANDKKKQAEKGSEEPGASAKGDENAADEAPEKATVGKPAPDFTLVDEAGNEHSLSDYSGQPVVLEWVSPECPYVQRHYEAGTMSETWEELGGADKVTWLAIDSSHFNKPKDSKAWKKKHGFDFPVLQDKDGKVGQMYGAKTTPHMYVIDKEGVLRYQGAIDDAPKGDKEDPTNYVLQAVQALQDGEKVEPRTTKPYGCSVKYDG